VVGGVRVVGRLLHGDRAEGDAQHTERPDTLINRRDEAEEAAVVPVGEHGRHAEDDAKGQVQRQLRDVDLREALLRFGARHAAMASTAAPWSLQVSAPKCRIDV